MEKFTRVAIMATVAMAVAGALTLLPLLFLDKTTIRQVAERALSRATGLNARIIGDIDISILGGPRAEFGRVYLADPNFDVTIDITSMSASLKYFPIYAQRVVFRDLRLIGPRLAMVTSKAIETDLEKFRGMVAGLGNIDGMEIDVISITNGRLLLIHPGRPTQFADAIDLNLEWQAGGQQLTARGQSTWRGRTIAIDAQIDDPVALLAGESGPARLRLTTLNTELDFDGTAAVTDPVRLSGEIGLRSQDPDQTLAWIVDGWPAGKLHQPVALSATGSLDLHGAKFQTLALEVGGQTVDGSAEVNWSSGRPLVQATLAFDTLEVQNPVEGSASAADVPGKILAAVPVALTQTLDLDIRLSVSSVASGPVTAQDVGASVLAKRGRLIIDVGEAQIFGGNMRFALAIDGLPDVVNATLRISGEEIDSAQLATALGFPDQLSGRLSGMAELSGYGVMPTLLRRSITGAARLEIADPVWTGLDVGTLLEERLKFVTERPAWLTDLPDRFTRLKLNLATREGSVIIRSAELEAAGLRVMLAGGLENSGTTLNLRGTVDLLPPGSGDPGVKKLQLPLIIGGSGANAKVVATP